MFDWHALPEWLKTFLTGVSGTFLAAWIGRMAWHVHAVQMGRRKFWSLHLLWEVPTAIMMGIAVDGLCQYFGLIEKVRLSVLVTIAYLGPRGIEALLKIYVERVAGGRP